MDYPKDFPAFKSALLLYEPAEDHEAAIFAAQAMRSPAVQAVETFKALREVPELSQEGLALLLSAAHMIAVGGFFRMADEAASLLATRAGELA